ncbi:hypothetical protein D3C87_1840000 [compost metagenome]
MRSPGAGRNAERVSAAGRRPEAEGLRDRGSGGRLAVQFGQRGVVFRLGFIELALRLVDLVLLALGARFL